MKRGTFAGLLAATALTGFTIPAQAEIKDNPYQVIIDRNPFQLKAIPPPEPPKKEEAPVEPPPDIKLTGITTLLGTPKVFLQLEDKKTKKPSFPPPLAEGETDSSGITIVAIDTETMRVRIKNGEAETTLDFKNNGVKPGGAAIAGVAPPPGVVPLPGAISNPGMGALPGQPGNPSLSGRSAIVAGGASPAPGVVNPAAGFPNTAIGAAGLPQRPLRTDNNNLSIVAGGGGQIYNPNPVPQLNTQPAMTKEEAELRIEEYKQRLKMQQQAGQAVPHSPSILPPTSIGRALEGGGTPTPGQNPGFPGQNPGFPR